MTAAALPAAGLVPDAPRPARRAGDPARGDRDDARRPGRAPLRRPRRGLAARRPGQPDLAVGRCRRQGRGADPVRRAGGPSDPDRERRLGRRPGGARSIPPPPTSRSGSSAAEPASGGLVPDEACRRLRGAGRGRARRSRSPAATHSPMRLQPEATTLALLAALARPAASRSTSEGPSRPAGGRQATAVPAEPDGAEPGAAPTSPARAGRGRPRRSPPAIVREPRRSARRERRVGGRRRGRGDRPPLRRATRRPGPPHPPPRPRSRLPYLYDVHPDARRRTQRELGVRTIDVADIAGTAVGGAQQRGGDFLPLKAFRSTNWMARWQRLGRASDTSRDPAADRRPALRRPLLGRRRPQPRRRWRMYSGQSADRRRRRRAGRPPRGRQPGVRSSRVVRLARRGQSRAPGRGQPARAPSSQPAAAPAPDTDPSAGPDGPG